MLTGTRSGRGIAAFGEGLLADEKNEAGEAYVYEFLASCSDEDLAPIVDVLKASPASFLCLSRGYELHHPHHALYADGIGDEVHRLALEALAPKERRRQTYDAMLDGVCRKIGATKTAVDRSTAETILLSVLAPRDPSTLTADEAHDLAPGLAKTAAAAVDGILTGPAWPPFAACIAMLALIRRHRNGVGADAATVPADHANAEGTALVVDQSDGRPLLSLVAMPAACPAEWRDVGSGDHLTTVLLPILKSLEPLIAADRLLANGEFVRVSIKGGAAALSTAKATGEMVGVAAGHKGMVPLLPVAGGAIAWSAALALLATTYMEQRRFDAIERGLKEIKASLRDVALFQQDERRSVITGSVRYFQQVAHGVLAGELDAETLDQIERHEADLVRIQDHLATDIDDRTSRIRALKNDGWSSSKFVKALGEQQAELTRLTEEAALCARARGCGLQLLLAYPGRDARKKARRDDVEGSIGRLCADGETGGGIDRLLREKLAKVSSAEAKAGILGTNGLALERIASFRTEIRHALLDARSDAEQQITLDVRLVGGEPVAIAIG